MKFELYELETNNSYGTFNTYQEAYEEKINVNHRIHIVCGGNYHLKLDIREIEEK